MERERKKRKATSHDKPARLPDGSLVGGFKILNESDIKRDVRPPGHEPPPDRFEVMKTDPAPKARAKPKFETLTNVPAPPVTVVCPRCGTRFLTRPGSITRCPVCRGRGLLKP